LKNYKSKPDVPGAPGNAHVQAFGQHASSPNQYLHGAMVRGDTAKMVLALVFTGDEYADGGLHIARVLDEHGIQGSFFLTGKFYRNPDFAALIGQLRVQTALSGGPFRSAPALL
jgi:hypothetical protein